MLSQPQFNRLAKRGNEKEGFSFKVSGPNENHVAKDAYMVGGYSDTTSLPAPVAGSDLMAHSVANEAQLSQPEMYLGGWHDKERGVFDVDTSKRYGRKARGSLTAAKVDAMSRDQWAIGEVNGRAQYVGDMPNPFKPTPKTADFSRSYLAQALSGDFHGARMRWFTDGSKR